MRDDDHIRAEGPEHGTGGVAGRGSEPWLRRVRRAIVHLVAHDHEPGPATGLLDGDRFLPRRDHDQGRSLLC